MFPYPTVTQLIIEYKSFCALVLPNSHVAMGQVSTLALTVSKNVSR